MHIQAPLYVRDATTFQWVSSLKWCSFSEYQYCRRKRKESSRKYFLIQICLSIKFHRRINHCTELNCTKKTVKNEGVRCTELSKPFKNRHK